MVSVRLSQPSLQDLLNSALTPSTIQAMGCRELTSSDVRGQKYGVEHVDNQRQPAYRIPYFDILGNTVQDYYRDKFVNPADPKYKYHAPSHSTSHVYFPPPTIQSPTIYQDASTPLTIVEGEKKAACLSQYGIPAIGIGGVDSYLTRRVTVTQDDVSPPDAKGKQTVNLPTATHAHTGYAIGFSEINWLTRTVYIDFDTDEKPLTRERVATSASKLALSLLSLGAQTVLRTPIPFNPHKGAPDDYIKEHGIEAYRELRGLPACRFPLPPNVRAFIREELAKKTRTNREDEAIAEVVVRSMDAANDIRINTPTASYLLTQSEHKTIPIDWRDRHLPIEPIGLFLDRAYGVTIGDTRPIDYIGQKFLNVPGYHTTEPRANAYATESNGHPPAYYHQINDYRYVKVTPTEIEFYNNGENGIFFLSQNENDEVMYPINEDELFTLLSDPKPKPPGHWLNVLPDTRIAPMPGMSLKHTYLITAALFYLNPYFRFFNSLQLPIEIAEAEGNSGKTTLYLLRKAILTGSPTLGQTPTSITEFNAMLTSPSPALLIFDNANYMDNQLRREISTNIARLVTDPQHRIEFRPLYTNTVKSVRVDKTIAFTSINAPLVGDDVIARSFNLHFDQVDQGDTISDWGHSHVTAIGRTAWVADQIRAAQSFLTYSQQLWDPHYRSSNRLQNFEQSLLIMGHVLNQSEEMRLAINSFSQVVNLEISEKDPIIVALFAYIKECSPPKSTEIRYQDICDWATDTPEYAHLNVVSHVVAFGKYIKAHKGTIAKITGLQWASYRGTNYLYLGNDPHPHYTPDRG